MDTSKLTLAFALVAQVALAQTSGVGGTAQTLGADGMANTPMGGLIQPPAFNWCGPTSNTFDRCTPVKSQWSCGSCWAFATTAVVENLIYLDDPSTVPDLSEQYLISCNPQIYNVITGGCTGGSASFNTFVDGYRSPPENAAGAVYESDFPNQFQDATCGSKPHAKHEKLQGWVDLPDGSDVRTIKEHIAAYGPIYADLCVDDKFQDYNAGEIYRDNGAPCVIANHAVVLVGWDDNNGDGFWILRNSWGKWWGDQGYAKVAYGANGVAHHAVAAIYKPRYPLPPTFGCSAAGNADVGFYIIVALVTFLVLFSSSKRR